MARATLTETASNGAEVYRNKIFEFADEYISEQLRLNPDALEPDDYKEISASFADMLLFIRDRIKPPSHDDIVLMDEVFDVFVRLCCRCRQLPTLEMYGTLVKTAPSTFSDWMNREYRKYDDHGKTVKRWKDICKGYLINSLNNGSGVNVVGKIFAAKSCYDMRETAPIPTQTQDPRNIESVETIRARHKLTADEPLLSVEDIRP